MRLFTTSEAAEYLRLKERKLYELVAEPAIACTKITGKWVFPPTELGRWVVSSLVRPKGWEPTEPMPIVGGSHDRLLEWALRESGSGLATLAEGSEAGLARFGRGEVVACGIHLHNLDGQGDPNIEALQARGRFDEAVLLGFARREQGLLVARGNPMAIASLDDALARRGRLAGRPQGAGAQLLLLALLHRSSARVDQPAIVSPACRTGPDTAQAIRADRADCGTATRSVAQAAGLDFVPIIWENSDLVVHQRDDFRPPLQSLLGFVRSTAFLARPGTRWIRREQHCNYSLRAMNTISGTTCVTADRRDQF